MLDREGKIFIAGHMGVVGSAILRRYQKEGFQKIIIKNRSELDLKNKFDVKNFFENEKPEYVILSAAKVGGIKANMASPADFLFDNLEIQNNVIWLSHLYGVKKLMFLGSSCIYPREAPQPMKEEYLFEGKFEPTNEGYAIAKVAGLKLCEMIYTQYNKNFISCMPSNIYGINDHFDAERGHVVSGMITRMHEAKLKGDKEFMIWGTGNAKRELLYVDDLADAVFWMMDNYEDKNFLNVGTGEDVSINELALMIKEVVGFEGDFTHDTSKPDGMPRKVLDVSKLRDKGWKHKVDLKEGLRRTYEYYLSTL